MKDLQTTCEMVFLPTNTKGSSQALESGLSGSVNIALCATNMVTTTQASPFLFLCSLCVFLLRFYLFIHQKDKKMIQLCMDLTHSLLIEIPVLFPLLLPPGAPLVLFLKKHVMTETKVKYMKCCEHIIHQASPFAIFLYGIMA